MIESESNLKKKNKKGHTSQNWLLVKVHQFLPYLYETWSKLPTHEALILSKFHKDRAKIVGLLLINSQV